MQARFRAPEDVFISTAGQTPPEAPALRGRFLHNEPMAKHVSWRAGGPAQRAYVPADLEDLRLLLQAIPAEEPVHMTGLGSNLLVRDGGVRGVVVLLHGVLKKLAIESRSFGIPEAPQGMGESGLIYAEAGVASPKVARFAANHNLVGAEFLAGIPGTVGGALAMNAGCYGDETWNHVAQVLTLDRQGLLNERLPTDYVLGYRHVALRAENRPHPNPPPQAGEGANVMPTPIDEWFVAGWFRFAKGDGQASRVRIKELLQKRIDTQPLNLPNAGSVFRNPPGDYAARLIEYCGLKGLRIGNAQVSEKHANFIVNLGGATAADIEAAIEKVEEVVEAKTNVRLMREVRIIGERA
jgi:UDP-N-acetylmuramate dehydrogenase